MTELSGRCLCGGVTWRTVGTPFGAGFCHCESCRRASSAPVTTFFGLPRDSVLWHGLMREYVASETVRRGFCPDCGTQLYFRSTNRPTETHLCAVTLDDPTQFVPQGHFHFAERLPWLDFADDLPKYSGSAITPKPE